MAVLLAFLWRCVFAPYKKYREEQLMKFTELVQQDIQEITPEEMELIDEKI